MRGVSAAARLVNVAGRHAFARGAFQQQARCFASADNTWHGTTIVCVRKDGMTAMVGDGQVSQGPTVVKGNAKKVRRISGNILAGFAGSTADALTLLEKLEKKLEEHPNQLTRACVELAKSWRTDKYLRRLEAVLLVADGKNMFELTGNGDVLEPTDSVMGVGSGGLYALSAARALMDSDLTAEEVARKAMKIAAEICVYTNGNVTVETVGEHNGKNGTESNSDSSASTNTSSSV